MGENGLMGGGGMTPADVAAVLDNGRGDGWGGNGAWWIIALFALMFGNNGWGNNGWGYQPQYATQDFVQNGFNFNDLQDQNRDIMNAISGGTAQAVAATNQAKYDAINVAKDLQAVLMGQLGDIRMTQAQAIANQNQCCCDTLRAIDGVNYNAAMNTAQITSAIAAEGQATRNMLQQDKIEALQQQVSSLQGAINTQSLRNEIREATDDVVRYPNGFVYNAGSSPFCGGWNGGCCNI